MSDEQRAGLALVLMVLVLMLWSQFYKPAKKPAPPPTKPSAAENSGPTSGPAAAAGTSTQSSAKNKASAPPAAPAATEAAPASVAVKEAPSEETVTVESGLYRVVLSNRGAVVQSWKLEKYRDSETPPKPLELVNPQAAEQLNSWPLSVTLNDPKLEAAANSGLYVISRGPAVREAPAEIDFTWSDGHLEVTKQLKFGPSYQVVMNVTASLDGNPLAVGVAWRGGFGDASVYEAAQKVQVFYSTAGKLETLTYKKLGQKDHSDESIMATEGAEFAGLEDQFFAAAFIPNGPGMAVWDRTAEQKIEDNGKTGQQPVVEMATGSLSPGPWDARLYVGPKDLRELGQVRPSLTGLVQFGIVGIIAKPLLELLDWEHKYVRNYGWCVILLTLTLTILLFPLKVKGWRAMQKMQKVQPEMKKIQDKYKKYSMSDPRRKEMNEEMMALYQREGINPLAMGGCLPTLLQMPILWALWRMLEEAIELRHAPWILWVHDLSAKDPYFILPIIVTITMYFMSKMTPTAAVGDPAQQKMMKYMPIAFSAFFFMLSAGVNLYMITSNTVGIAQQWYLVRTDPLPSRSPFKKKPAKA